MYNYQELLFRDSSHEQFYHQKIAEMAKPDRTGYPAMITYLLGADQTIRDHYNDIFDARTMAIRSGCWDAPWHTTNSRLLIAAAMALSGNLETPLAAAGTILPYIQAAWQWSDMLDRE